MVDDFKTYTEKKIPITCGIFLYNPFTKLILACRSTGGNNWSIPKGMIDSRESEEDAAKRELQEETGIVFGDLDLVKFEELPIVTYKSGKKRLKSFLAIINDDLRGFPFKCTTFVEDKYPEVDKWELLTMDECEKKLHKAQVNLIPILKENIIP